MTAGCMCTVCCSHLPINVWVGIVNTVSVNCVCVRMLQYVHVYVCVLAVDINSCTTEAGAMNMVQHTPRAQCQP